jgi:hypothetical protein
MKLVSVVVCAQQDPPVRRRHSCAAHGSSVNAVNWSGQPPSTGTRQRLNCPDMLLANSNCDPSAVKANTDEKRRTAKNCSRSGSFRVSVTATARTLQFSGMERSLPWAWYTDPDAAPLAEALGDVPAQLAEILDVDTLEFRFRAEFELEANWKISCENFLECYHCAVAHPGFSAAVDVSPDAYRLEARGLVSSQVGPLRRNGNSFLADGEVPRSQFHFLWPNFGLNVFPDTRTSPAAPCSRSIPSGRLAFSTTSFSHRRRSGLDRRVAGVDNQVG